MAEMTREALVAVLRRDNPQARIDHIHMYADCFLSYQQAAANIAAQGAIVAHPRTGAPMENPYLKVQLAAMAGLRKLSQIRQVNALWD